MADCEMIRQRLLHYYGKEKVICRIGNSTAKIEYGIKEEDKNADMVVYIHSKHRIAVVWNLEERRNKNREVNNMSVPGEWKNILKDNELVQAIYKRMGNDSNAPLEKVIVLSVDVLKKIYDVLYLYLQINIDDKEYPDDVEKIDDLQADVRQRVSTSRWERDRNFRRMVLDAYGKQCAICRCKEEKLLQAAHLHAVAAGGTDEISNGICLCANHHIMYDEELLTINLADRLLTHVSKSVKSMPWYSMFEEKYAGKLLSPQ